MASFGPSRQAAHVHIHRKEGNEKGGQTVKQRENLDKITTIMSTAQPAERHFGQLFKSNRQCWRACKKTKKDERKGQKSSETQKRKKGECMAKENILDQRQISNGNDWQPTTTAACASAAGALVDIFLSISEPKRSKYYGVEGRNNRAEVWHDGHGKGCRRVSIDQISVRSSFSR